MPKRKPPSKREPNGRKSRRANSVAVDIAGRKVAWNKEDQDMVSVAIEARQRVWGLSVKESRDQKSASFIGRLCLHGELSEAQFQALDRWNEDRRAYSAIMAGPKGDSAQDPNRMPGRSGYENPRRDRSVSEHNEELRKVIDAAQIRALHRAAERAIQDKQFELRNRANLWGALDVCVTRDRDVFNLVGDLREAANALVRHYGIEARAAA